MKSTYKKKMEYYRMSPERLQREKNYAKTARIILNIAKYQMTSTTIEVQTPQ